MPALVDLGAGLLDRLSAEVLFQIIAAERLKDLYAILGKAETKELLEPLDQGLRTHFKVSHKAILMMRSITDTPSVPFNLLWTLISVASLGVLFLAIASALTALITLIIAPIMYVGSKKEEDKKRRHMLKDLTLAILKQKAATLLLQMHHDEEELSYYPSEEDLDKKYHFVHLKQGLANGFQVVYTFFCTFFASGYAVMAAFETAAAATIFTGGLSLAISLSICLLLSVYLGVQQYRASREEHYCAAWQKQSRKLVDDNQDKLEHVRTNPLSNLRFFHAPSSRSSAQAQKPVVQRRCSF